MLQGNQTVRFWIGGAHRDELKPVFDGVFDAWLLDEDHAGYWVKPSGSSAAAGTFAVLLKREFVLAMAIVSLPVPSGARPSIGFRE